MVPRVSPEWAQGRPRAGPEAQNIDCEQNAPIMKKSAEYEKTHQVRKNAPSMKKWVKYEKMR